MQEQDEEAVEQQLLNARLMLWLALAGAVVAPIALFAKHAPNGPVVAIPARDMCAFCDAGSATGVAQLRALAARIAAGGNHLIGDKLFVRQAGRWRTLEAEAPRELPPLDFNA
jgi:hypothetical protein